MVQKVLHGLAASRKLALVFGYGMFWYSTCRCGMELLFLRACSSIIACPTTTDPGTRSGKRVVVGHMQWAQLSQRETQGQASAIRLPSRPGGDGKGFCMQQGVDALIRLHVDELTLAAAVGVGVAYFRKCAECRMQLDRGSGVAWAPPAGPGANGQ